MEVKKMKSYIVLNDDGEVLETIEAENLEEAESLSKYSDYYKLEEVK